MRMLHRPSDATSPKEGTALRDTYRGFVTILAGAVGAAALFWLLHDHWGHAFGLLPYLLFLICPLMHLRHGHGGRHHPDNSNPNDRART